MSIEYFNPMCYGYNPTASLQQSTLTNSIPLMLLFLVLLMKYLTKSDTPEPEKQVHSTPTATHEIDFAPAYRAQQLALLQQLKNKAKHPKNKISTMTHSHRHHHG